MFNYNRYGFINYIIKENLKDFILFNIKIYHQWEVNEKHVSCNFLIYFGSNYGQYLIINRQILIEQKIVSIWHNVNGF